MPVKPRISSKHVARRPAPRSRFCLNDARGGTIVEFALVAAPLIALLLAIIETSLTFFAQQGLETTAEAASRLLMTGQAQQANMNAQTFKNAACNSLPPFLSCSNLFIDVTTVSSYSGAFVAPPKITYDKNGNISNNFSYSPGGRNSIVVLRLMYASSTFRGPLGLDLSNMTNNRRLLMATSVLMTENY